MAHQESARTRESAAPQVQAALLVLSAAPDGRRFGVFRRRGAGPPRWPAEKLAKRLDEAAGARGGTVRVVGPEESVPALLDDLLRRHGPVPAVLMGFRATALTALREAGHPAVSAVCAVALPVEGDGLAVEQLTGRQVMVVDGGEDSWGSPEAGFRYASRARPVAGGVCRFEVHGDGEPLARRTGDVHELVCDFAVSAVLGHAAARPITDAMAAPAPAGLRMPLASGFTSRA